MKLTQAYTNQVVLKSLEIGIKPAADLFEIDPEDVEDYQRRFIRHRYDQLFPPAPTATDGAPPAPLGFWNELLHNPVSALAVKVCLAIALIVICYLMPALLQSFVDPLTNTVVWLGFTALYILTFVGMGIDLVLFIQHKVNFDFLNPLSDAGFDYATILRSDNLTPYEKCRINQQKYLAYLFAYCLVVLALASLTSGGGV
ncbi:hypothetical protein GCM10027578_22280 [Spirosoma luteolum]